MWCRPARLAVLRIFDIWLLCSFCVDDLGGAVRFESDQRLTAFVYDFHDTGLIVYTADQFALAVFDVAHSWRPPFKRFDDHAREGIKKPLSPLAITAYKIYYAINMSVPWPGLSRALTIYHLPLNLRCRFAIAELK